MDHVCHSDRLRNIASSHHKHHALPCSFPRATDRALNSPLEGMSDDGAFPMLSDSSSVLATGVRLQVQKQIDGQQFFHRAEIMATRVSETGNVEYYVHFIDFNKRLDEWVPIERMDVSTVELASKNSCSNSTSRATKTPATSNTKKRKRKLEPEHKVPGTPKDQEQLLLTTPRPHSPSAGSPPSDVTSTGTTPSAISIATGELTMAQEMEKLRRGGSMTQRPEEIARVKNIDRIEIGSHIVRTWYFSPYPQELCGTAGEATIYICEFCLFYFASRNELQRHRHKCTLFHPPGNEIYRQDGLSFWEVDGHRQKIYSRNLCLLSKLFLDHKTLFYDVDPFLFYILTENDARGCHLLGYFSKEKESADNYNVACILTLPQHQRKGYGKLLIEFSYELTKREGKVGSPEKPLSDLGLLSYRSYWCERLTGIMLEAMRTHSGEQEVDNTASISIDTLSQMTGFTCDDILHTLQAIDALKYRRGQHVIVLSAKAIQDYERGQRKTRLRVDQRALQWTPPVFSAAQLRFL